MFKRYQSKPVTRLAYQIQENDEVAVEVGESPYHHLTTADGDNITFVAHEEVKTGDYVVYLNEQDIYHCNKQVFNERNEVKNV